MVFSSIPFAIFFTLFFLLYWLACFRSLKVQNFLLLIGSYVFYAWGDWRFLPLLICNSALYYLLGMAVKRTHNEKTKLWFLLTGLALGLGGLIFFKYTIFLLQFVSDIVSTFGFTLKAGTHHFILPLGISFFTFRNLSYLIDVYKGKVVPTKDWVVFFSYVAFFPSLIAGPIDKSKTLMPQLENKRVFDYVQASDGMRQIVWGLFKKIVIADNCATFTDEIFGSYQELPASSLLLGAFFYTIQIYADFSGYSDMAIGFSRLLGFKITKNFDYPLFSQNIAEFWRKWHISLTSWLTEYLFTPLNIAFRDMGKLGMIFAIIINFTLIGIWHGANWTFVLFGFLHGCFFIPLVLRDTINKKREIDKSRLLPNSREAVNMILTFSLVMFSLILFRSTSVGNALNYFQRMVDPSLFSVPVFVNNNEKWQIILILIFLMLSLEWLNREKPHALAEIGLDWSRPLRWLCYYILILFIYFFAVLGQNFIYVQF
jgi:alginate O-acetyltransferase complex protein AlgI